MMTVLNNSNNQTRMLLQRALKIGWLWLRKYIIIIKIIIIIIILELHTLLCVHLLPKSLFLPTSHFSHYLQVPGLCWLCKGLINIGKRRLERHSTKVVKWKSAKSELAHTNCTKSMKTLFSHFSRPLLTGWLKHVIILDSWNLHAPS